MVSFAVSHTQGDSGREGENMVLSLLPCGPETGSYLGLWT